ncbi:hypothetical protein AAFF_G00423790 [Aldrovandia affinis]|uniref:Uncharacterized protein n=1 Tax=Aldrovandia affinis TaxID=143900 RepID=A0AAD7T6Q7_9TELE|nr:hypothetical protein AAFF_G00423790 [Aldrovandia affinis]
MGDRHGQTALRQTTSSTQPVAVAVTMTHLRSAPYSGRVFFYRQMASRGNYGGLYLNKQRTLPTTGPLLTDSRLAECLSASMGNREWCHRGDGSRPSISVTDGVCAALKTDGQEVQTE